MYGAGCILLATKGRVGSEWGICEGLQRLGRCGGRWVELCGVWYGGYEGNAGHGGGDGGGCEGGNGGGSGGGGNGGGNGGGGRGGHIEAVGTIPAAHM